MALQLGALREALIDAGASPEKAKAASEEVAAYVAIEHKLTLALWAGGLLFAALLTSQALLWSSLGKLDGQLTTINSQLTTIRAVGG